MAQCDDSTLPEPQALRDLAGIVLGDHSFSAVLQRASEIAQRAIPGADDVSVTMKDRQPTTVASSGPLARRSTSRCSRPLGDRLTRRAPRRGLGRS